MECNHKDCFTCPYDDCISNSTKTAKNPDIIHTGKVGRPRLPDGVVHQHQLEYQRQHYQDVKEYRAAYYKEYYKKNKERIKAQQKQYRDRRKLNGKNIGNQVQTKELG